MSNKTGSGERSTSLEKTASVTVSGLAVSGNGFLHFPHTGASPLASFAAGTRLLVPHTGHWIMKLSGMWLKVRLAKQLSCVSLKHSSPDFRLRRHGPFCVK